MYTITPIGRKNIDPSQARDRNQMIENMTLGNGATQALRLYIHVTSNRTSYQVLSGSEVPSCLDTAAFAAADGVRSSAVSSSPSLVVDASVSVPVPLDS